VTVTLPHIPEHTPFTTEEWNVQRNLKTPLVLKILLVVCPAWSVTFFDQFVPRDVTVCGEHETAFQITLAPLATVTDAGNQAAPNEVPAHFPLIVVDAWAGSPCAATSATTAAPNTSDRIVRNMRSSLASAA
jgi:hypothetical protein